MSLIVLHAIPSLIGGGAERQLSLLAPELSKIGVSTHLAYIHEGVNISRLKMSQVNLHALQCAGNHDPRLLLKLVSLIRGIRPDIVQTWLPQMDILGGLAALIAGTPFILSERSSARAYPPSWKHLVRFRVGLKARMIVANSQGGIDYWNRSPSPRRVIRNGLPLHELHATTRAATESLGLPADARLILFAGRLSTEKNVSRLMAALDCVLVNHADTVAVVFGDGPLRATICRQASRMAARDRVRVESFTVDLWKWMRRASVFVSVSLFEGHPNTVLEAAALGCPLVLSSIPQHREILSDEEARYCDPKAPHDISRAIEDVLGNRAPADTRAAAAARSVSESSIAAAARAYLQVYEEVLSRSLRPDGSTNA
jgi:glycosyltransferase involved in cell wall biosynthesis